MSELRGWISDAATEVVAAMLQGIWKEFQYRLDICRVTHGANTEHM
jgi:hypothetical protein